MNRLSQEKSPYLLQHADNPVDWYPWGAQAFARAAAEDKPVFLSVGYATCHWCHVMARESFADAEVAALLNEYFIAVKVDREERPDVDTVYMEVCQALTGGGGWPLSVLMTPEQQPFWAGTYLPKGSSRGQMGLLELLKLVEDAWRVSRAELLRAGAQATALLQRTQEAPSGDVPDTDALCQGARAWFDRMFDEKNGGFGRAPKFPTPHNLQFLLRYAQEAADARAQFMAERTLRQMYRGGIFDHIGGGFSRYSTDTQYLVPHFEKMLYDNALLADTYMQAFVQTKEPLYASVAMRTLDYMLRELTHPEGGFFSGQDADSEGEEGKFYALTPGDVAAALPAGDAARFCAWYDITPKGHFAGKSIPNLRKNPLFAGQDASVQAACARLYEYRRARARLATDDKVLLGWNALAISALVRAARALDKPRYLQAAVRAQRFIQAHMRGPDGRMRRRWRDGEAAHEATLEDYAAYALALLDLYGATLELEYLQEACALAKQMRARFADAQGGFFLYASDAETLIARPKEVYDGALPSGNALAAMALVRLDALLADDRWRQACSLQLAFVARSAADMPAGHTYALLALLRAQSPGMQLVCATAEDGPPAQLRAFVRAHPALRLDVLVKTRAHAQALAQLAPFTQDYPLPDAGSRYYLCRNHACAAPAESIADAFANAGAALDEQ
nr:thioredoxin domain-containing protein [Maliibacterium massiliense]